VTERGLTKKLESCTMVKFKGRTFKCENIDRATMGEREVGGVRGKKERVTAGGKEKKKVVPFPLLGEGV